MSKVVTLKLQKFGVPCPACGNSSLIDRTACTDCSLHKEARNFYHNVRRCYSCSASWMEVGKTVNYNDAIRELAQAKGLPLPEQVEEVKEEEATPSGFSERLKFFLLSGSLKKFIRNREALQREKCAKVAEKMGRKDVAAAIRKAR